MLMYGNEKRVQSKIVCIEEPVPKNHLLRKKQW